MSFLPKQAAGRIGVIALTFLGSIVLGVTVPAAGQHHHEPTAPNTAMASSDHAMADGSEDGTQAAWMSGMTPPAPAPLPPGPILRLGGAGIAQVSGSPGRIVLALAAPVVIESLELLNPVGQRIPNHLTLPGTAQSEVTIPLPIPLPPGAYRLRWHARMEGAYSSGSEAFVVLNPDGSAAKSPSMHHHHGG